MKKISIILLTTGTLLLAACSSNGTNNGSMNGMQHTNGGMQHNMNNM